MTMKESHSHFYTSLSVPGDSENISIDMWDVLDIVLEVTSSFSKDCQQSPLAIATTNPGDPPLVPTTSYDWFYASREYIVQTVDSEMYDENNLDSIAGVRIKVGSQEIIFDVAKRYAHFKARVKEDEVMINSVPINPSAVLPTIASQLTSDTSPDASIESDLRQVTTILTGESNFMDQILEDVVVPSNIIAIQEYAEANNPAATIDSLRYENDRTKAAKALIDFWITSQLMVLVFTIMRVMNNKNEPVRYGLAYKDLMELLSKDLNPISVALSDMSASDNLRKKMEEKVFWTVSAGDVFACVFTWVLGADGESVMNYLYSKISAAAISTAANETLTSDTALISEMRCILRGERTTITERYVSIIVAAWLCAETSRYSLNFVATICLMDCIEEKVQVPHGSRVYTVRNCLSIPRNVQVKFVDAHGRVYEGKDLAMVRGYHPMVHFKSFVQTIKFAETGRIPRTGARIPMPMQKTACIIMQWFALCLLRKDLYSSDKIVLSRNILPISGSKTTKPHKNFVLQKLLREMLSARIRSLDSFGEFLSTIA